uniref:Ovule protein n=1 Tax=Steinernema glaseri TaxID=37863 RepID=A0A1I8ALS2_9BILA
MSPASSRSLVYEEVNKELRRSLFHRSVHSGLLLSKQQGLQPHSVQTTSIINDTLLTTNAWTIADNEETSNPLTYVCVPVPRLSKGKKWFSVRGNEVVILRAKKTSMFQGSEPGEVWNQPRSEEFSVCNSIHSERPETV